MQKNISFAQKKWEYFLNEVNMKKVSIVIPVYNAEKTLDRCLGSIFAQGYKDFEIIAVNDESTDKSLEVLAEYAKKDSRLTYCSIAHGGVSAARNAGLEKADGYYLQFVDADDDLDPNYLEKMVNLIESTGSDMAICRYNHVFFKTYVQDKVYDLSNKDDLLTIFQDTYALTMPWNKLWKRDCFTRGFDPEVHFAEDELNICSNLHNVKKIAGTSEYLYHYFFATKENSEKEESAVNNIINSEAFWNNKTSFYFMGASLYPKRKKFIEEGMAEGVFPKDLTEMPYIRVIDYGFWQLPAYVAMGIPEEGMAIENYNIFTDPLFIQGYKEQEKYGFRLKKFSDEETRELAKKFTSYVYRTVKDHFTTEGFEVAYAFISIFLKLFAEKDADANPINYNVRFMNDMENNATLEAKYVNEIMAE